VNDGGDGGSVTSEADLTPLEQPVTQIVTSDAQVKPTMPFRCEEFTGEQPGLLLTHA
jgi:hypothetical protein